MQKYRDIMVQVIDLTSTMIEGTTHMQVLLKEGKFEQSIILFEDVMKAYAAVERSVAPVLVELEQEDVQGQLVKVRESLELVVSAFEKKEFAHSKELLQFGLIPALKKTEAQFTNAFSTYLVS
ncbi:hypothetical protein AB685_24070 [Bacillus sp. LL01]|uniref:hypothetical protein n=1 Tax=Bacillus sp. LL01 TaxID=1665556 RepID=UPI00064D6651|nr:hypothetical protein [Bacillus sp. LL01]KMJ56044.1 hypothetical protein AB685_24070 [Bacillus sp. LL01]